MKIAINDIFASIAGGGSGSGGTGIGNIISAAIPAIFGAAKGAVIDGGNVVRFAKGGIVGSPQLFGLNGGLGVRGEAGPEAILPVTKGPGGVYGVRNWGGGGTNITFNVQAPNPRSFQQSGSEIQRSLLIATKRGQRNG